MSARGATGAARGAFRLEVEGAVLEGFIDLLIETPDGLEIVDWKTDQITAPEAPNRLQEYRLQAGLYVFGIESATRRQVSRITYVFASARIELSPGEPAALAVAARERLLAGVIVTG